MEVYQCTWHRETPVRTSMINFVVPSSDLQVCVLDIQGKRGANPSTEHHLVVSWIRWRRLKRVNRTKHAVRVCWERLPEPSS